MKHANVRWMAVAALALGLGFGATVSADSDPFCQSTCQELMNDCLAQVPSHQFKICARQYRECQASCEE